MTNGHTHFFLIGDDSRKFEWGDESKLKFDLAQRIALGRGKFGANKNSCKMVTVLLGDNQICYKDIELVKIFGINTLVIEFEHSNCNFGRK